MSTLQRLDENISLRLDVQGKVYHMVLQIVALDMPIWIVNNLVILYSYMKLSTLFLRFDVSQVAQPMTLYQCTPPINFRNQRYSKSTY